MVDVCRLHVYAVAVDLMSPMVGGLRSVGTCGGEGVYAVDVTDTSTSFLVRILWRCSFVSSVILNAGFFTPPYRNDELRLSGPTMRQLGTKTHRRCMGRVPDGHPHTDLL